MIHATHIDRFKVIKVIGQGGQGEVIHVRDTDQKDYALKWLLPHVANKGSIDRFLREFQSIRPISHPNIIKVFEQGQFLNRPYFTMELVTGENLEQFLEEEKSVDVYYDILIQISNALAYIHDHRLIHRDIKPSNILIDSRGQVKIMDFGLVKNLDASLQLTQADKFFGTMSYASPEQLLGEKIDYRSDLYSFGVMIYRIFSCKLPFHGESMVAIITKHLSVVPTPLKEIVPNCPPVISDICDRLLMKSPLDRDLTATDVAEAIRAIQSEKKVPLRHSTIAGNQVAHRLQTRFQGRDREIHSLIKSIDTTDNLSIRLICGEQGIGKTRLINEGIRKSLIAGSKRRLLRYSDRAGQQDRNRNSLFQFIANEIEMNFNKLEDLKGILPEIAPLHPAFQRFDPTHSASDPTQGRGGLQYRIRYLSAIVSCLTQQTPWHIIWENLHQATAFEIECLTDLVDLSSYQPIRCCIWATIRTDDFLTSQDFHAFITGFLPESRSETLILKPLRSQDAQSIIASLIHVPKDSSIVEEIIEYCHGNPSVLLQTIQHWIDNGNLVDRDGHLTFAHSADSRETVGPIGQQDIARQRLSMVSKNTKELLTWIAALEQDAYLEVIRNGMQFVEKELMNILNDMLFHNFITSQTDSMGERYLISNPVLKSIILANAGPDDLQKIHIETIGIMELLGGHYATPALLARHQEKAGRLEDACKNYYRAALDAYSSNQLLAAHDFAGNAHRLIQFVEMESKANLLLRARVLVVYCKVLLSTGTMDEKQRVIPQLKDLLPSVYDASIKYDLYHFAVTTLTYSYRLDEARQYLREYETAIAHASSEKTAIFFQLHGMLSFFESDYVQANRYWKKALILQKTAGAHPETLATIMFMLAKTLTASGRYKASFQLLKNAFKLIPKAHAIRSQAMLLAEMGNVAFYQEQTQAAIRFLKRALSLNDTLGLEYSKACNLHDLALCHHQTGNFSEAFGLCRQGLEIFRIQKTPRENAMGTITSINLAFTMGNYKNAMDEWTFFTGLFGEDMYYQRYPYLAWLHHRTLCLIAHKEIRQRLRVKLVGVIRRLQADSNDWREGVRLMLMHERIARNELKKALRIARMVSHPPASILSYIPIRLNLFMLEIACEPEGDHLHMLDEALMAELERIPSMHAERACLQALIHLNSRTIDWTEVLGLVESVPTRPGQIWMMSALIFILEKLGLQKEASNVRRMEHSVRLRMTDGLPDDAKQELLSRKFITRI